MKAIAVSTLALFIVVVGAEASPAADANGRGKALLIGKQPDHPYGSHTYLHTCRMLAECLRLNGLEASVSDGWPKSADELRDVKTIVVYTSPAAELLLDGPQRDQVDRTMKAGVGLVTIHWASSVMQQDFDRLGARWLSYLGGTWVSNVGLSTDTSALKQLMPEHPICRGWSGYELHDEYYLNPTISKGARPLLQVTTKGQDVVVGWAYERPDGGRAYGTTLGHFYSNFEREPFRRAIVNAILWTAKRDVPEAGARVDIGDDFLKLPPEQAPAPNPQGPARGNDSSRRVLRFPADRAVGTVYWRMPDGKPYMHAMYADSWKPIGKTRGTVRLPADAEVRLDVGKAASRDLSWLDDLGPGDIQALNLHNTDVRDEALHHITRLMGLRAVDLQSTRITDAGIEGFDALVNLEEIDLGAFSVNREGFGVGDAAMRVLGRLPKLRNVQLRLSKVSDAGLAEIVKCGTLANLGLAGTKVSDGGLMHLTKLPQLESLSLGVYREGANVTNEGLKTVGKLVNLTWLDLSGTKITGAGLVHLSGLKKLKGLSLDSTDVAEADLAHLEPLQSLERLRLYTKHSTTDIAAEHIARLKSLRDVSAHLCLTDKGVALLATMPHLEQLFLNDQGITDACAGDIAKMKSLKWLWFQNCPISDSMLQAVAELPNLEYLLISHTRVTGDGFAHLQKLPSLSILDVNFDSGDQQPAAGPRPHLREIGKLTQLKDLRLEGDGLAGNDLKDFRGLAALEALDLSSPIENGGVLVDDEGAAVLATFQRLKSLEISNGTFTDVGLERLSLLPQLETAQIKGRFTDEGLLHLARLEKLRHLWVDSPRITDVGLLELAARLPSLQYAQRAQPRPDIDREVIAFSKKDMIRRVGDGDERATKDTMEGQPPPQLHLAEWLNADDAGIRNSQFGGKVVLIDFWGTWCGPCRALTPKLKELHEKYAKRGLLVMGVHTTRFADTMADYVSEQSIAWPVAADVDGATAHAWKVQSYPSLFLIDRSGKVRIAGLYRSDLERAVVQLLEEPVPEPAGR